MKKLFIYGLLCLCYWNVIAQNKQETTINNDKLSNVFAQKLNIKTSIKHPENADSVKHVLTNFLNKSNKESYNFKLVYQKESPVAYHYLFQQVINNIPVFNHHVKINIDKKGKILTSYYALWNTKNLNAAKSKRKIEVLKSANVDATFENKNVNNTILTKEMVWVIINNKPEAAWNYTLSKEIYHLNYLIDYQGNIIYETNLNCNHRSLAVGYIYKPDPVTTAKRFYNPPFVHANNTTNASLDSQRVAVPLEVTQENGFYVLKNSYVAIADYDNPFIEPPQSATAEFYFNRSQSGFEDINVLYHITQFQEYIQSLGFDNLSRYQIQADAHALNGDDNSLFSSATNPPRLFFGTGGVEDAEDADVIIHEYGHSLSFDANNTNIGNERRALDEGLCDYFATSYSKSIDTFRWADMFTWDGHNEFWNGRNANTTKKYPAELNNSIHSNGEMWSSALMEIWDDIGKTNTDKLMLQTLYSLAPNMTLKDAAYAFIDADSLLFNGNHFCNIYPVFSKRGLVDSLTQNPCAILDTTIKVNIGENVNACFGDSITIVNQQLNSGLKHEWYLNDTLKSIQENNFTLAAYSNAIIILRVSLPNGRYNVDTISLTTTSCGIVIKNSAAFATGSGNLIITIPDNLNNQVLKVFDLQGKTILETKVNKNIYFLSSNDFSSGVYFISIYGDEKKPFTQKVLRF